MASLRIAPKNSILKRPIRSTASRANNETADEQYKLEQERLQRLRAKRQQLAETRGTILHGTPQQKATVYSREQATLDEYYQRKKEKAEQAQQDERRIAEQMQNYYQTLNESENVQTEARKHYNQQLLEENKRLLQYRNQLKQQTKQQEIEHERQLTAEYQQRWKPNAL